MLTIDQCLDRCRVNAEKCTKLDWDGHKHRSEPRRDWERKRHPRRPGLRVMGEHGLPNLYAGRCVCGITVAPYQGEVVRDGRRWQVLCPSCRMGGLFAVALQRGVRA